MVDELDAKMVQFPNGDFLNADEAGKIVRSALTNVIVVAGVAGCGKTTLVAGLYDLFHRAPFANYFFAGSRTLPGFEERCHLARIPSGLITPDTERTKRTDSQHLLHLRLAEFSPLRYHNLLFSDVYGEAFRRAADSADECRKLKILKRADHIAVLIDGEKAVSRSDRQEAFSSADALIGQCLDSGMLGEASSVQAIVTKWDKVAPSGDQNLNFIDAKLQWLNDRHGARLGDLRTFKVASRPLDNGAVPAGFGMEDLLRLWINVRSSPRGFAKLHVAAECYTEFDRFCSPQSTVPAAEVKT